MADIPAERRLSGETIYSAPGYTDERLHALIATVLLARLRGVGF